MADEDRPDGAGGPFPVGPPKTGPHPDPVTVLISFVCGLVAGALLHTAWKAIREDGKRPSPSGPPKSGP